MAHYTQDDNTQDNKQGTHNNHKQTVLVAGGTGFVGRSVVAQLQKKGYDVIIYHRGQRAVPTHADYVINCVGIIREKSETFEEAHIDVTKWLVRLAKKVKAKRFVHISAMGVEHKTTKYWRTKHAAEGIVKSSKLPYTILRPSLIFGDGDASINQFRALCRTGFFPAFSKAKVQPVHVSVVAAVVVRAIEQPTPLSLHNKIVDVAGPEQFTYLELARRIHPGVRVVRMPRWSADVLGVVGVVTSKAPTKEMLKMLRYDSIASKNVVDALGIKNPKLS